MIYGYIRVSTDQQDYNNQKHGILEYLNQKRMGHCEFVEETISTRKKFEERDLSRLIAKMQPGDILVTSELSRLGRSILEVMTIFKILAEKNIETHIIKGGFVIGGNEDKIKSSVLVFAFGLAAEIERELISQRTKEALARRKAEGKRLGRQPGQTVKSILDPKYDQIYELLKKGVSVSSIAKILECSQTTLRNFIKSRKIKEKIKEEKQKENFQK